MTPGDPARRMVHYVYGSYLPLTENWIHAQIGNLQRYRPIVYCRDTENLEIFHTDEIRSIGSQPSIARFLNGAFNRLWGFYPSFVRHLMADKPVLVHAHFGHSGYGFLRLKRLFGVPLVTTFYGYDMSGQLQRQAGWLRRYQKLFRRGDLFLVEGSHMRKRLLELGCRPEKAMVQHIGVDLNSIAYQPRRIDQDAEVRILVAGSFREKKGIPYAIEAFGRARKVASNLRLTIIGDSPGPPFGEGEKRRILQTIETNGLSGWISMLGYRTHPEFLEELYKHHIFLAPSIRGSDGDVEGGAPVSILEASASGMPVLSSLHCDIPEVVLDGRSGYLVPERDVERLAARLVRLVSESSGWPAMGEAGRKHIEEEYNLTRQVEKLESIYDMISDKDQRVSS